MSLESIPGHDAWKTRTPEDDAPDHIKDCPQHEDNVRECPNECDGCACHVDPPCTHCIEHIIGECECPTKDDIKEMRAEAREDR